MTPFNIKMNSLKANSIPNLHVSVHSVFSVNLDTFEELSLISLFPSSSILRHQILFIPLLEHLFLPTFPLPDSSLVS